MLRKIKRKRYKYKYIHNTCRQRRSLLKQVLMKALDENIADRRQITKEKDDVAKKKADDTSTDDPVKGRGYDGNVAVMRQVVDYVTRVREGQIRTRRSGNNVHSAEGGAVMYLPVG